MYQLSRESGSLGSRVPQRHPDAAAESRIRVPHIERPLPSIQVPQAAIGADPVPRGNNLVPSTESKVLHPNPELGQPTLDAYYAAKVNGWRSFQSLRERYRIDRFISAEVT